MNPHFFTAPFYFAFIWFRVQGSGGGFAAFLEEGILVSQPSPLGNAIKLRKSLAAQRLASPSGEVLQAIGAYQRSSNNVGYTVVLPPHLTSFEMASHWIFASLHS